MTDVTKLAAECVHTSQMLRHDGRLLAAAGAVGAAAGVYLYVRRRRSSHPPQMIHYDEFGLFRDNCTEHGLVYNGPPTVVRERVVLPDGRGVSALRWGEGEVEMVLLHGGAQNAHTFDTVALALSRPMLCIDLPSHGHSDTATSVNDPHAAASDVAAVIEALAPSAKALVGMSFGGLTAIALSAARPELVRRLALIDITPGVTHSKAKAILDFVSGPTSFDCFDSLLARAKRYNPTRTEASLRRGILHNALQRPDGSWVWRHARFREADLNARMASPPDYAALWAALSGLRVPCMLVRGMRKQSVVDDDDEAELLNRQPNARVERVAEAGHSVQGDAPLELAALLASFVDEPSKAS